jgi:protein-S-isoprenylcysteine O-methyltransferase Ste14
MKTDYTVLLSIFAVCLTIRTSYELLKKTSKIKSENKIFFIIVLIAMILLWASWFGMCAIDPYSMDLPDTIRTIGLILLLAGLALAFTALFQLRGVENIDHLVTTGLFSLIRHPMYTGFILWIVGWSVYHGAAISLVAGIVGIANIVFWGRLEEQRLRSLYGERYLQYRGQTLF